MPYYEWRGSGVFRDARNDRELEQGDVVELPERVVGNHDFVEADKPDANPGDDGGETDGSDADDGESDGSDDEITCAEGDCSRTVSEAGETCWQHSDDE